MMSSVSGKVAFVTGGASGIGAALSTKLVDGGAEVWIADRQVGSAQELAQRLNSGAGKAHAIELDVRSYPSFEQAVGEAVKQSGRIDYLFNNAGIGVGGEVDSYTLDDWNDVFDVNLRGVVHGIQAVYPIMIQQHSGHIVNTASMAGLVAAAGATNYTASKHAVVALSKALRLEAERHGVQVSVLCPGAIRTPILEAASTGGTTASATSNYSNSGRRSGRWHPKSSPSARFAPCCGETQSLWCQPGGRHGGTWNASRLPYRCGLQDSRSSAYVEWNPPPPDRCAWPMVRRTGSNVAWGRYGG